VAAAAAAALTAGFAIPSLRELLQFEVPTVQGIAMAIAMGAGSVLVAGLVQRPSSAAS
jgi:hypothetical protein